jgi:VWFA-related protein
VDLVEIDLVATDATGRPVLDLKKEDLQVLEDGKPREIASLALVNLPVTLPHLPFARDVSTNAQTSEGRLFFLILDDVHTLRERSDSMKGVARRFVERLAPGDQVAVAWVSLGNAGAREFTTNHAAVLEAIDRLSAADTRVARRNPDDTPLPAFSNPEDRPTPDATALAMKNVKGVFDRSRPFLMVNDVCSYLASLPHRRKSVVFVGTGPTNYAMRETVNGIFDRDILDFTRAVTSARRANVAVYMLDPSTVLRPDVKPRPDRIPPTGVADAAGAGRLEGSSLLDLVRAGRTNGMAMLSMATGGLESRGPAVLGAVDRVVSDTGTYYLLGYYADPPTGRTVEKLKGLFDPWSGFRSIEVRTTRPSVSVRARKGYWAGGPDAAAEKKAPARSGDETATSVAGVLPQSALSLRAFVAPLRGKTASRQDIAVIVEAEVPPVAPATPGLPLLDDVELLIAAVAPGQGVRATDRATVRLPLGVVSQAGLVSSRYRLCARVSVAPGHYQVRLGVRSTLAGKTGSVYADVSVADFFRQPLSLSGLFLERRGTVKRLPTVTTKGFSSLVPFEAALDRDFEPDDEVWARVRAYRGKGAAWVQFS